MRHFRVIGPKLHLKFGPLFKRFQVVLVSHPADNRTSECCVTFARCSQYGCIRKWHHELRKIFASVRIFRCFIFTQFTPKPLGDVLPPPVVFYSGDVHISPIGFFRVLHTGDSGVKLVTQ
uniref:Uncharacterized protein n=1 Tax=Cacopsylla melanoneura TaxID=428564 RepID=A0A8D8ZBH4_9HEMI